MEQRIYKKFAVIFHLFLYFFIFCLCLKSQIKQRRVNDVTINKTLVVLSPDLRNTVFYLVIFIFDMCAHVLTLTI